jgi:hypothetical protein
VHWRQSDSGVQSLFLAGLADWRPSNSTRESRPFALTSDFREVFAKLLQKHMGVRDLEAVFFPASNRVSRDCLASRLKRKVQFLDV